MTEVYRAQRPISWAGTGKLNRGDLIINPPEFVPRKLAGKLERLDEDGRLERDVLRRMHYTDLQKLAANGDVDEVNGNSKMEEIIDAYALEDDESDEDDPVDEHEE